jgi:transposase
VRLSVGHLVHGGRCLVIGLDDDLYAHPHAAALSYREIARASIRQFLSGFKAWLIDAAASDLKPFVRLATGMTDDLEAITDAFRYSWSTGPVEGHITRVKLIKRAGYGRAKLPLLRARILGPN